MKHSGVSVHHVQAGAYPEQCDAPVTVSGGTWYVHFLPGRRRMAALSGVSAPRTARLLATGEADLAGTLPILILQVGLVLLFAVAISTVTRLSHESALHT